MTSLIDPVTANNETNNTLLNNVFLKRDNHKCRHVLKSKENTLRSKCDKALKRKLKQYKLRPDGKEDQDVLDVSNILVNSLTLKSPGSKDNQLENQILLSERPKNYLFRMVRNKHSLMVNGSGCNGAISESDKVSSEGSHERKQTNAFKLLMDSRNKSIGGNSPGKEKVIEENVNQDIIEKQEIKAKRILVLQKMSEAKGSLKKKEMEECQDKYIQVEMKKRADKFKNMLLNQEPKPHEIKHKTNGRNRVTKTVQKVKNNNDAIETKNERSLQLVSLFNDTNIDYDQESLKKHKNSLSKEDKEFLDKLSPSMRRKGNMLCYFMKIEKEAESSAVEDEVVIKVKLPSKNRKSKNRKKQVRSIDELHNENTTGKIEIGKPDLSTQHTERHKRKRNHIAQEQKDTTDSINILGDTLNRPKRNVKKPIKYSDDILLSSSDEECHIFTPKKKKHIDNRTAPQVLTSVMKTKGADPLEPNKKANVKKNVKLAPIFNTKHRPDVSSEAKQKFLQSGVPEQLKKIIIQQKNNSPVEIYFPAVVHIQQKNLYENFKYPSIDIPICDIDDEDNSKYECHNNLFKMLLDLSSPTLSENVCASQSHIDVNKLLQQMKQARPKFPVYRTYRLLRDKRKGEFRGPNYLDLDNSTEVNNSVLDNNIENSDQLNWTDKYKATSTNQIIGNYETVKELKKWLIMWTETEQKSRNNANSDSSDFYHSDTDSRESVRNVNNLLIITGPTGTGKTSSVYAVAADLAIKVIEVNASNKRTGKIILQDLHEATQSHKVNRGTTTDNISKSQDITTQIQKTKTNKRGRPKKNVAKMTIKSNKEPKHDTINALSGSQDVTRTDMSLILIDDADIMFDQDDGFCSAIAQLVHSSKRPVILVTSSLSSPHLQRFLQNGKILKMNPLSPHMLGSWLDIMCLADSGTYCPGVGAKFLNYYNGDIRKTINCLQFYVSSQSQSTVLDEISSQVYYDTNKLNIDDEKSNMSWIDQDDIEERKIVRGDVFKKDTEYIWNNYVQSQFRLMQLKYPLETFNMWWSLPQALNLEEDKASSARLESIANTMDCMSISDFYCHNTPNYRLNITTDPWMSSEAHSVSEYEDITIYRRSTEVCDDISYALIENSIINVQGSSSKSKTFDIDFPGMTMQRERNRIVSRHNSLSSYLNPSAVMDRRALALDYWTSCRTISRIEKTKSDNYSKRNNRFCHYLKSLNILCKNELFDDICNSLALIKNRQSNDL